MSSHDQQAGPGRRAIVRFVLLLSAACETGQCPTELDLSGGCFSLSCADIPKQPYVTVATPSGRVRWDTLRVGETAQLTATLRDTLGNPIAGRTFRWRSFYETKATVSATGIVTALAPGTASIIAQLLPDTLISGYIDLAIVPGPVTSIAISPASATIRQGESRTFVARTFDAYGFQTPDTVAIWSSDMPAVATISATGVAAGIAIGGPARITATIAGKSVVAPVQVIEPATIAFKQLALGGAHTCGLTRAGLTYCWGRNSRGQLGDSTTVSHFTIAPVLQGALVFVELSAGTDHTCARTESGQAYCWGASANGQLGDGGGQYNRPYPVAVSQSGIPFISLGAGEYHTCGLAGAGDVYCWGGNLWGQAGDGDVGDRRLTPVRVSQGTLAFASVAVGTYFSCALTGAGQAYCWGANDVGQLGDSTATPMRRTPVAVVQGNQTFAALAAGSGHVCGLTRAGAAVCWGRRRSGVTGAGLPFPSAVLALGQHFTTLATPGGREFQCGVASGGQPACWGRNSSGQLGVGNGADSDEPGFVFVGNENVQGVATGSAHGCAWMQSGRALCWGLNSEGQLGDGTITNQLRPVPVKTP